MYGSWEAAGLEVVKGDFSYFTLCTAIFEFLQECVLCITPGILKMEFLSLYTQGLMPQLLSYV